MAGEALCARTGTPNHADACFLRDRLTCEQQEHKTHTKACNDPNANPPKVCDTPLHTHTTSGPPCRKDLGPFC